MAFHARTFVILTAFSAAPAVAQPGMGMLPPPPPIARTGVPLLDEARTLQRSFELYRRDHLPTFNPRGATPTRCDEQVGRFCYWYDEKLPDPPPEPHEITRQRTQLIAFLDSAAKLFPDDDWVAGQRVRYLVEAERGSDALGAALACRAESWWCSALVGFSQHELRHYAQADSAYQASLAQMDERRRCDWSDVGILLDEYTNRTYRRFPCGSVDRARYERRLWTLAKPLFAKEGLDTRSEYFARMTMARMLEQAPSTHLFGFDADERELLLRYGWPRAWTVAGRVPGTQIPNVTGHEPSPAYQYLPPALLANSPAMSDSADWEDGVPPIHARYAAAYARRIRPLTHQSALFRRGDSSLVVLAWESTTPWLANVKREMSVALLRADSLDPVVTRRANAPMAGVMLAKGPWSQLVFSAELTGAGVDSVLRARYGMRPPYAIGARVTLSEMLFFAPYDGLPETVDSAAAHALPSIRIREGNQFGVYFESYGTNPAGEELKVTLTVAREEDEPGFVRRRAQALGISREASPVSITHTDISARNAPFTTRSFNLDVSKLKKGAYIVQLQVDVSGQYTVRSEKSIEIY